MTSITQGLLGQLQGNSLSQIGQKLGITPEQAAAAVAAALPLLIGAMGRNARQPQAAQSLFGALQRDHLGQDPQSVLGSVLGGGGQGSEILGHIFGSRQQMAAQGLGTAAGVGSDRANELLRLLAPVVMAYVAKRMSEGRQQSMANTSGPAPTPESLGDELGREEEQITQQGGIAGGLLGAVLDRNHDGRVDFSDMLALGARGESPTPRS